MPEPIQIEKDKTYVLEVDHVVSNEQVREIIQKFKESTGSNVIVLNGARLARVASEAEEAIERVRKIHTPFWLDEPHCSECHSYEVDENYALYPCPTIKALDGETDEA
jgi:hypothetical protein